MSDFHDHFLRGSARPGGWLGWLKGGAKTPAARVRVVAFGKHPGWDDHLDDVGEWTESLALARRVLYAEGIAGQLDAGTWEALPKEQRLPRFEHVWLWRRGECSIVGRLWSSTDGKGRARYPMAVCAEVAGLSLDWVLEEALPRLETLEAACRATDSPAEVRASLTQTQADLIAAALQASNGRGGAAETRVVPEPWHHPEGAEAALRVLYCIRSQLAGYRPGWNGKGQPRALRFSLPPGTGAAGALHPWATVFGAVLDPCAPVLFTLPAEAGFLDVLVGEPVSESFFGLRATLAALPAAAQVPHRFDASWKKGALAFLAGLTGRHSDNTVAAKTFWRLASH